MREIGGSINTGDWRHIATDSAGGTAAERLIEAVAAVRAARRSD